MPQAVVHGHHCQARVSRGSPKPFTSLHTCSHGGRLLSRHQRHGSCKSSRQSAFDTQCVAPNTSSVGRRVVGSVATAAFLTWALRSASAKSMKPADVQRRSKEEENAVFENREGEVSSLHTSVTHTKFTFLCACHCRSQKPVWIVQVHHTDTEWKSILSPGQYRVLRQSGTELPLSSPLDHVSS